MSHIIELAKSGRAGCRKCRAKITKGELRFGHEVPNAFDDGAMTHQWYHLNCAAEKLPVELLATLEQYTGEVPDRDELLKKAQENRKKVKPSTFPYAEAAPSGRSSCMVCDEKIAKGELRVAVEREIDAGGLMRKGAGYLHPGCCGQYEEIPDDLLNKIKANSTSLSNADLEQLSDELT